MSGAPKPSRLALYHGRDSWRQKDVRVFLEVPEYLALMRRCVRFCREAVRQSGQRRRKRHVSVPGPAALGAEDHSTACAAVSSGPVRRGLLRCAP